MYRFLFILLGFIGFLGCFPCRAQQATPQETLELTSVLVEEKNRYVELGIRALRANKPIGLNQSAKGIQIIEQFEGMPEQEVRIRELSESLRKARVDVSKDTFVLYFLVDCSSAMGAVGVEAAKKLIYEVISAYDLSEQSSIFLAAFAEEVQPARQIKQPPYGANHPINALKAAPGNPDLYRAIIQALEFLNGPRRFGGKKLLFILSNGKNDITGSPVYAQGLIPPSRERVLRLIQKQGRDNYLFPIALGVQPELGFLKELPQNSVQEYDLFQENQIPDELSQILKSDSVIIQTHVLKIISNEKVFIGKPLTYKLLINGREVNRLERNPGPGTLVSPVVLSPLPSFTWWVYAFVGIGMVVGALGIFTLVVPIWKQRQFKKTYVREYAPQPKKRITDPVTKLPIEAGDLVVTACAQTIPFNTWKGLGWQCPEFPECMQNPQMRCNGKGAPQDNHNFFTMFGIFRRLNWLWFGMAGGFLSWIIFALFKVADFPWYKRLVNSIYQRYYASAAGLQADLNLNDLADGILIGIAFGSGLTLMLSWVEERSQPRKRSVARVLGRTFAGAMVCGLISLLAFVLQYQQVVSNTYLAGFLNWLLFGLAIGLILPVQSSIDTRRGLLAGILSGVLGFLLYFGGASLIQDYFLAKLFSLIGMGGLLGWVMVTVSETVEDFEIEYIAPKEYQRIVPISKWLRSGLEIAIGTEQGSYVYVKWSDPAVLPKHAVLLYENGQVFLSPHGEVLRNGELIPNLKKTLLRHGDILQLGRDSTTRMRYKEKRAAATQ